MVKTTRLKKALVEYLKEGNKNFTEINDYINRKYKHGTSYHVLCNVMAKSGLFEKRGTTIKAGCVGVGGYKITVWGLKNKV